MLLYPQRSYIIPHICLFVCLSVGLFVCEWDSPKFLSDFYENLYDYGLLLCEEIVKFWR